MGMLCTELHVLPGPGSLLEQDSLHVWLLTIFMDAMTEREQKDAEKAEAKANAMKGRR
jgi:hypothetical protein